MAISPSTRCLALGDKKRSSSRRTGSDAYNEALSERRAEAVKRFLVEKFNLSAERLIGIGFGKEQLKDETNPFADENRRVQVVNLSTQ